jgi:predicted short-subunit dehydrogenase-like oxidoreductase (DUF2520 family)
MNEKTGAPGALIIVGAGRAGGSIAAAAERAGIGVSLLGRGAGADLDGACVLLCVPDTEIAPVAVSIGSGPGRPRLIGHVSGATPLEPLRQAQPVDGCFSLHPLQTLPDRESDLTGAPAAVAGTSDESRSAAKGLARALEMVPFEVGEEDRVAYHAAASIASNFLVTLEQSAADLLGGIGVDDPRRVLAPLVRRSLENWIADGPAALTGPIARGDEGTVQRHREALSGRAPGLLPMYDAMAEATRAMGTG